VSDAGAASAAEASLLGDSDEDDVGTVRVPALSEAEAASILASLDEVSGAGESMSESRRGTPPETPSARRAPAPPPPGAPAVIHSGPDGAEPPDTSRMGLSELPTRVTGRAIVDPDAPAPGGLPVAAGVSDASTPTESLLSFSWLANPDAWQPGALISGRYRLLGALGSGGMGEVLLAEDLFLRRKVAMKTLRRNLKEDPKALERFRHEVAVAHAVSHVGVARTFDLGEFGGVVFLTMEYLEGQTLGDRIKAEGPLPEREVRRIGLEVAAALDAAHQAGVIHRDLKPNNVQLTPDRGAVVMDFGLAAAVPEAAVLRQRSSRSKLLRSTSKSAGTPYYMAPEQWRSEAQGVHTDIYSFGLILYESITGKKAFVADDKPGMMKAHLEQEPPLVRASRPGASRGLERLIHRCMRKDPALRPSSTFEIARQLVERRINRHVLTAALALGVLALFVVGGWLAWRGASLVLVRQMRPGLQHLASLIARDISGADLDLVHKPEDMKSPPFGRSLAVLQRYKKENPQVRYIYTLRKLPPKESWQFVVDADPVDEDENGDGVIQDSEKGSPPGMVYDATGFKWMWRTYQDRRPYADDKFDEDPWGLLLSGYAPVQGGSGEHFYLVGVDLGYGPVLVLRNIVYGAVALLGLLSSGLVLVLRRRKELLLSGFSRVRVRR